MVPCQIKPDQAGSGRIKPDQAMARQKAHEFCSCMHLELTILGTAEATNIAAMLGLPAADRRQCTPWGEDVTYLCFRANYIWHSRSVWSLDGWILDDLSMEVFYDTFPDMVELVPTFERKRNRCGMIPWCLLCKWADSGGWERMHAKSSR